VVHHPVVCRTSVDVKVPNCKKAEKALGSRFRYEGYAFSH